METFLRRFRGVNARRTELLAAADREAHGQPLPVELIVECMMRPSMEAGIEHPQFNKLLARTLLAPPKFLHQQLQAELEPNLKMFIGAFERALPEVPTDVLNLRLALALGATLDVRRADERHQDQTGPEARGGVPEGTGALYRQWSRQPAGNARRGSGPAATAGTSKEDGMIGGCRVGEPRGGAGRWSAAP